MSEKKKGCETCVNFQYDSYDNYSGEGISDGWYSFCDKRDDSPEEIFKTWPCRRKLKCHEERKS